MASACAAANAPASAPTIVDVPAVEAGTGPIAVESATAPASSAPLADEKAPASCDEKCNGKWTRELASFAQQQAAKARRCYNLALAAEKSPFSGKMRVLLKISETGAVCDARLVKTTVPDSLNACVLQLLQDATYPAPVGGCVNVLVPMTFEPMDAGAAPAP
jgi:hypothetical protein